MPDSNWHHFTLTYDGVGVVRWYIDGQLNSTTNTGTFSGSTNSAVLTFHPVSPTSLDEVALYDHTLSATEVTAHYRAGTGADTAPTYQSVNGHGLEAPDELQSVLDDVGHHGGCSEVGCLIKAYEAEGPEAISGGSMRTVHVFNDESSRAAMHGTPANPCGRCQAMLGRLGISWG